MNEYQSYKVSGPRKRPSSVTANSRLLRGTYASRGKDRQNEIDSEVPDDPTSEGGSMMMDDADQIKMQIEIIDNQISKLGGVVSCGWDAADHKDFLRVRTKHKERVKTVAFMTEMRRSVPTADEDQIKDHIEVFQKIQDALD